MRLLQYEREVSSSTSKQKRETNPVARLAVSTLAAEQVLEMTNTSGSVKLSSAGEAVEQEFKLTLGILVRMCCSEEVKGQLCVELARKSVQDSPCRTRKPSPVDSVHVGRARAT
jgi:hypothetical protein